MIKIYDENNNVHPEILKFCKNKSQMDENTIIEWKRFQKSLSESELKEFRKIRKRIVDAEWRRNNHEIVRFHHDKWAIKNTDKVRKSSANWNKNNKDRVNEQAKLYRKKHPRNTPEHRAYTKQWRIKNKEKNNKQIVKRNAERRQTDELFAAKEKLRAAVGSAFQRIKKDKPADTQTLLGCTWEEAKSHIEGLWKEGMNWQNHGKGQGKWNIDHIRPVSSFQEDELHLMNLIENLQPLWFEENIAKRDKH